MEKLVTIGMEDDQTNALRWKHHVADHDRGIVWDTVLWRWSLGADWTVQRSKASTEADKQTFITAAMQAVGISTLNGRKRIMMVSVSPNQRDQ